MFPRREEKTPRKGDRDRPAEWFLIDCRVHEWNCRSRTCNRTCRKEQGSLLLLLMRVTNATKSDAPDYVGMVVTRGKEIYILLHNISEHSPAQGNGYRAVSSRQHVVVWMM